jgi:hypothetical protein
MNGPGKDRSAVPSATPTPSPARDPEIPPLRLVYIVGAVRSGSTALDVMLGSLPGVVSGGEMSRLAKYPKPPGYRCSCGKGAWECPFWAPVLTEFDQHKDLAQLHKGWRRYEGFRALPRALLHHWTRNSRLEGHLDELHRMLGAVSKRTGATVIVDSSKDPVRGLLYTWLIPKGVDVRLVHLIRDGRGFLWSMMGRPDGSGLAGKDKRGRPIPVRSIEWLLANLASSLLFRRQRNRYHRIRYEDLMADPAATLEGLGKHLGLDLSTVLSTIQADGSFPVGHPIGGNRLRFSPTIRFRRDAEWESRLPRRVEWTFWLLSGWLARTYGYTSGRSKSPGSGAEGSPSGV